MDTYTALFEYFKDGDIEGFNVVFPAIPSIVTWGRTMEEAEANAAEALHCHLEGLRLDGEALPSDISVDEPVHVKKVRA
jgi:predicted RNase H-like HicB family nuclease